MASSVYLGLVHYPIYNKRGEVVCTAITNYDIHDIARVARTYGVKKYFIIQPQASQARLASEVISYWQEGYGGKYNPDRSEALGLLSVVADVDAAVEAITAIEGQRPLLVATDAHINPKTVSYQDMRQNLAAGDRPCLLLFGTGWGMERSLMDTFDHILEPIYGIDDYNHLSVRAAVAIIIDRLLGTAWYEQ